MNEGEIQFAERLRRIGFAIYSGGHMRRKEFIRRAIEAAVFLFLMWLGLSAMRSIEIGGYEILALTFFVVANAVGAVILLELYWKWKDARDWQEYKPKWKDPQSK